MIYDDDGQVDGDFAGSVNFTPNTAQPWLRSGMPPWHLWGNTQRITTVVETGGVFRQGQPGQLVKVSYKRPETWQWLFHAKLISGPENTATFFSTVFVVWDLTIGVGRSAIQMVGTTDRFGRQSFERFDFQWGPVVTEFPVGAKIYTSQVLAPNRFFTTETPGSDQTGNAVAGNQSASTIEQIVAQDIQLQCRVVALTVPANLAALNQPVEVEVSAAFAPRSHVRPDWYRKGPAEIAFPGDEIEGR